MAKFKAKINNNTYEIKDGFIISEDFTETLDSGSIIFSVVDVVDDIDVESFDLVKIYDDETNPIITDKKQLVDTEIDVTYAFTPTEDHEYTINTFSRTKDLERVTLPNLSITQPQDKVEEQTNSVRVDVQVFQEGTSPLTRRYVGTGTYNTGIDSSWTFVYANIDSLMNPLVPQYSIQIASIDNNGVITINATGTTDSEYVSGILQYLARKTTIATKKSVYDKIRDYYDLFVPEIRVGTSSSSYQWQKKYGLASRVQTKFSGIDCPELQWNTPTLREVLTDLMYTANCIPIINNNGEIDYLDLTYRGTSIDVTKLDRAERTKTSADYCSDLTINMKNAVTNTRIRMCEYTSLRCNEGILDTTNALIKTTKPIYKIVRCTVGIRYQPSGDSSDKTYQNIDITECIKEVTEWSTLGVASQFTYDNTLKASNLYFTRGGNTIEGWGDSYRMGIPTLETHPSIFWVIASRVPQSVALRIKQTGLSDIRNFMVKLEYEALDSPSLHIGRYLPLKHPDNRVFDNQSESYVDAEHQSIFEYAKVNRLGNAIRKIYATYQSESELPHLGDYLKDEVLFSRKMEYFDGQINFEGSLIKNFVLKDYFTGVQAKRRSWAIAKSNEALTRINIYKYNYEASFSKKTDSASELSFTTKDLVSAFLSNTENDLVKFALIQTKDSNNNLYPTTNYGYCLGVTPLALGMSLYFGFTFTDNYAAGDYIVVEDNTHKSIQYAYADRKGEFNVQNIMFAKKVPPANDGTWSDDDIWNPTDQVYNNMVEVARTKPKVRTDLSTIAAQLSLIPTKKDNREIIAGSLQIEYCADTEDIIIGSQFVKDINLVTKNFRTAWQTLPFSVYGTLISLETGNLPTPIASNVDKYIIYGSTIYKCISTYNGQIVTTDTIMGTDELNSSYPASSHSNQYALVNTAVQSYRGKLVSTSSFATKSTLTSQYPPENNRNKFALCNSAGDDSIGNLISTTRFTGDTSAISSAGYQAVNYQRQYAITSSSGLCQSQRITGAVWSWVSVQSEIGSNLVTLMYGTQAYDYNPASYTLTTKADDWNVYMAEHIGSLDSWNKQTAFNNDKFVYGINFYQKSGTQWSMITGVFKLYHCEVVGSVRTWVQANEDDYTKVYRYTTGGVDTYHVISNGTWVSGAIGYEWQNRGNASNINFAYINDNYVYYFDGVSIVHRYGSGVNRGDLRLYWSDTKPIIADNDMLPSSKTLISGWSFSINTSGKTAYIDITLSTEGKSYYYLTDSADKVLIAFKRESDTTSTQRIYFNLLKSRDTNIYNSSGEVVDDIIDN